MPAAVKEKTISADQIPEGLSSSEFDKLMHPRAIGDRRAGTYARDRMLLELLAGTGLRITEALTLVTNRVDVDDQSLWVAAQFAKSGKGRRVYFGADLREKLIAYLRDLPPGQTMLFVTRTGAQLTSAHVRRLFKKVARRAGLDPERIHPHVLRHTYAIRYLSDGGTLESLREQLGHRWVTTTAIYLQSASWHRKEQVAKLNL